MSESPGVRSDKRRHVGGLRGELHVLGGDTQFDRCAQNVGP